MRHDDKNKIRYLGRFERIFWWKVYVQEKYTTLVNGAYTEINKYEV